MKEIEIDWLYFLSNYANELQKCKNVYGVSNWAVKQTRKILGMDVSYLKLRNSNRRIFKTIAEKGFKYFDFYQHQKYEMPIDAGMAGFVVRCRKTVANTDYSSGSMPYI